MMKPLLIAFEGGDGCGKSTQAQLLATRLDALLTRQAGGTALGEQLRAMLLADDAKHIAPRTEALLYMADRAEHVEALVRPTLVRGQHVVSDRWAYSSLVYQGYGRGLDIAELHEICDWSLGGLWPDVVLLLDIPAREAEERRRARLSGDGGELDRYEAMGNELQARVVTGYKELALAEPHRWRTIDASGSVAEVHERVWKIVEALL